MNQKLFRLILASILIVLLIVINMPLTKGNDTKAFTLPGLPRPIANVPFVISSAGQSTDTYIIRDISNQLMLRNFFMPQARDVDIKDVNTIVFVVGYSALGVKLQGITYEDEKERIEKILQKVEEDKLKVLTVAIGAERAHDDKTEELLRLIGSKTDYFIGLRDSNSEEILNELAKDRDIPLTLVNEVSDIAEPFASAFR